MPVPLSELAATALDPRTAALSTFWLLDNARFTGRERAVSCEPSGMADAHGGGGGKEKKKKDAVPLTGAAKRERKAEDELKEQTKRLADMGLSFLCLAKLECPFRSRCPLLGPACQSLILRLNLPADLLHMGRAEITSDADAALEKMQADKEKRHGKAKHDAPEMTAAQRAAQDQDPGILLTFLQWLLRKEKKPPLPWTISRREEVDSYLVSRSFGPYAMMTLVLGESFWYNRIRHKKLSYTVSGLFPACCNLEPRTDGS